MLSIVDPLSLRVLVARLLHYSRFGFFQSITYRVTDGIVHVFDAFCSGSSELIADGRTVH